ncbi:MAG: response regulator transcription factor, partial [Fusobacteriaceae bacterium]|nr:response regulator transcription factor [Fusobacteriaceae bacterium]
ISIIKDKFQDIIGVMIIGKEVKEVKQLKTLYQLTDRQIQIIQYIISGIPNNEIASNLGIVERTIKGHITGIYDKLCVDNKIQLFNLLKDFNLIPERSAEKTTLLLKKR